MIMRWRLIEMASPQRFLKRCRNALDGSSLFNDRKRVLENKDIVKQLEITFLVALSP